MVDDQRRYRRVNSAGTQLLGASPERVLSRRIDDFTPPEHWALLEGLWKQFQRDGTLAGYYEVLRGDRVRTLIEYRAEWDFQMGEHLVVARELPARAARVPLAGAQGALLTAREREVMQLAADGLSAAETAERLACSVGTVKTHLHRTYHKLGTRDRAAAVAECLRRGLIA